MSKLDVSSSLDRNSLERNALEEFVSHKNKVSENSTTMERYFLFSTKRKQIDEQLEMMHQKQKQDVDTLKDWVDYKKSLEVADNPYQINDFIVQTELKEKKELIKKEEPKKTGASLLEKIEVLKKQSPRKRLIRPAIPSQNNVVINSSNNNSVDSSFQNKDVDFKGLSNSGRKNEINQIKKISFFSYKKMGSNISRINNSVCLNKNLLETSIERTPSPPKKVNQSVEFTNIQSPLPRNSKTPNEYNNTNHSKPLSKSHVLKSKNSFPIDSKQEVRVFGPETPLVTFESPPHLNLQKNDDEMELFFLSETPTLGKKSTFQKQGTLDIELTPRKIQQDLSPNNSIIKGSKRTNIKENQSTEISNSLRNDEISNIPKTSTGTARALVSQNKVVGRIRSTTVTQSRQTARRALGQSFDFEKSKEKEGIRQSVPVSGKLSTMIQKIRDQSREKNLKSHDRLINSSQHVNKKAANRYAGIEANNSSVEKKDYRFSRGMFSERQRCNDILLESSGIKQEIQEDGKELRKFAHQYSKKHEQVGELFNNLKHVDSAEFGILQILYNYHKKGALLQKREENSIIAEYNEQCNERMGEKYKTETEGLKKMFKRQREKRKALLQSIN